MERLQNRLQQIDGRGYKSYKQLKGVYRFPAFALHIDHVQGDPFADASRCRIVVGAEQTRLPSGLYANQVRRIALEDYLGRRFERLIRQHVRGDRGSGCSGEISIVSYAQQVLQRNAVLVRDGEVELRVQVGLPGNGRSVAAGQARIMLFDELVGLVDASLLCLLDEIDQARAHVDSVENQHCLRDQLASLELCAFVADGSSLPRRSGIDDRPLVDAVPFQAPESLAVTLKSLHGEDVRGLGVARGVTLIVGGGFHGKSTLLQALERGVYDHIPGDGREQVVTDPNAVKIRAEDGRAISGVDIRAFINRLPQGRDTRSFTTPNASGSTSQAANIIEALATGADTLLIDEDTSATNFMVRDERMQALVSADKEPITPLVQRIRELYLQHGVSVIIVMGGSGEFFGTADQVIMMDNYLAKDVTEDAHRLATEVAREGHELPAIVQADERRVRPHSLDAKDRMNKVRIKAFDARLLRYGGQEIDVSAVEQLTDNAQLRAIGYLMRYYSEHFSSEYPDIIDGLRKTLAELDSLSMDCLTPYVMGTLAMPRLHELAATINRLRSLELCD